MPLRHGMPTIADHALPQKRAGHLLLGIEVVLPNRYDGRGAGRLPSMEVRSRRPGFSLMEMAQLPPQSIVVDFELVSDDNLAW